MTRVCLHFKRLNILVLDRALIICDFTAQLTSSFISARVLCTLSFPATGYDCNFWCNTVLNLHNVLFDGLSSLNIDCTVLCNALLSCPIVIDDDIYYLNDFTRLRTSAVCTAQVRRYPSFFAFIWVYFKVLIVTELAVCSTFFYLYIDFVTSKVEFRSVLPCARPID